GFEAGMQTIELLHKRMLLTCQAAQKNARLEALVTAAEAREPCTVFALPFNYVPLRPPLPNRKLPTAIFGTNRQVEPSDPEALVAMRRGVSYFVKYSVTDLRSRGVDIDRIHIVGGGTKSPSFCQLVANTCEMPVLSFGSQAAAVGAAI